MRSLKLSDWANIAEIVASVVIVASLVYVGRELNQNTRAMQNESYQYVLGMLHESQLAIAMDEDFHRFVITAQTSPDDVSAEDWSRYTQFMYPRVGVWEFLYLEKQDKAISDTVWGAFEPYFLDMVCTNGYRRFLDESYSGFAPTFIEYVETTAIPTCN